MRRGGGARPRLTTGATMDETGNVSADRQAGLRSRSLFGSRPWPEGFSMAIKPRRSSPAVALLVPEIVTRPAEIDTTNAHAVGDQLRAALRRGVPVVIADMSATAFCDSSGIRQLL